MENLNELKPVGKLSPFAHFCCTIGNLPTSYMISLTYEEQLLWLCNYLEKTVIPAVNTNAEAVAELQNLYVQLKNYVDNYFEDLNSGAYASQVSQSDTETKIQDETNAESSSNTIEKFTRHEEGDNGVIITNQRLVKEYREIIVAIDEEIINELSKLFMGIY